MSFIQRVTHTLWVFVLKSSWCVCSVMWFYRRFRSLLAAFVLFDVCLKSWLDFIFRAAARDLPLTFTPLAHISQKACLKESQCRVTSEGFEIDRLDPRCSCAFAQTSNRLRETPGWQRSSINKLMSGSFLAAPQTQWAKWRIMMLRVNEMSVVWLMLRSAEPAGGPPSTAAACLSV